MREYLFRGKCGNKWHYGDLYTQSNTPQIIAYNKKYDKMDTAFVDPETVGQYTGLKDKNGVKIFEGDIVQTKTVDTHEYRRTVIGIGLCVESKDDTPCIGVNFDYFGEQVILQVDMMEHLEVIGNIHDNKEILKEGEE